MFNYFFLPLQQNVRLIIGDGQKPVMKIDAVKE